MEESFYWGSIFTSKLQPSVGSQFSVEMDTSQRSQTMTSTVQAISPSDEFVTIRNLTRGTVVAERAEVARTSAKRSKGLLGRKSLDPGGGMWIVPCESVHTFFMQFPIDLIYLDKELRVKKVRPNVKAWRISACLTAHSIIELPAGTIRDTQTQPRDILQFGEPSTSCRC